MQLAIGGCEKLEKFLILQLCPTEFCSRLQLVSTSLKTSLTLCRMHQRKIYFETTRHAAKLFAQILRLSVLISSSMLYIVIGHSNFFVLWHKYIINAFSVTLVQ